MGSERVRKSETRRVTIILISHTGISKQCSSTDTAIDKVIFVCAGYIQVCGGRGHGCQVLAILYTP